MMRALFCLLIHSKSKRSGLVIWRYAFRAFLAAFKLKKREIKSIEAKKRSPNSLLNHSLIKIAVRIHEGANAKVK